MISFAHWLVIMSIPISMAGAYAYIHDTLAGRTKPNRVSWFLWALAPMIGVVVALSAHADMWATSRPFIAGFIPLTVFVISFFNPRSYWKLTLFDCVCGAFSLIGLSLWLITHSTGFSIACLVLGDAFASIPTLYKAWKHPETETGTPFIAGTIAGLLVLPSIPVWNIPNAAFPIYLLMANMSLAFAVYQKRIFAYYGKTP